MHPMTEIKLGAHDVKNEGDVPRLVTGSMTGHVEDVVLPNGKAVHVLAHEILQDNFYK